MLASDLSNDAEFPKLPAGALSRPLEHLDYLGFDRPVVIFRRLDKTWAVTCEETFKALSGRMRPPIVGPDLAVISLDDTLRLAAWAGACSPKAHSLIVNFTTPAGAEAPGQSRRLDDRIVVALAMIRLGAPGIPVWVAVDPGGSARWYKRIAAWDDDLYSGIAVTGPVAASACRTPQETRRVYLEIGKKCAPKPVGMIGYALPELSDRLARRDDAALAQSDQRRTMLTRAGFKFVHIKER